MFLFIPDFILYMVILLVSHQRGLEAYISVLSESNCNVLLAQFHIQPGNFFKMQVLLN